MQTRLPGGRGGRVGPRRKPLGTQAGRVFGPRDSADGHGVPRTGAPGPQRKRKQLSMVWETGRRGGGVGRAPAEHQGSCHRSRPRALSSVGRGVTCEAWIPGGPPCWRWSGGWRQGWFEHLGGRRWLIWAAAVGRRGSEVLQGILQGGLGPGKVKQTRERPRRLRWGVCGDRKSVPPRLSWRSPHPKQDRCSR